MNKSIVTEEMIYDILELRKKKITWGEISKKIGISTITIRRTLKPGKREADRERNKAWEGRNKERSKRYTKEYYQKNKDKILIRTRKYHHDNKERNIKQAVARNKERYHNDLHYRIASVTRTRIRDALKNNRKSKRTLQLVGCSVSYLKEYIELQFQSGMTWENYGLYTWHVDHIKACHTFDLSKPEEQEKCFHYTNLRPLWATENLRRPKK